MPEKTGWPPPALMQDDCRGLSRWFASRPDARRLVRLAAADLPGLHPHADLGDGVPKEHEGNAPAALCGLLGADPDVGNAD